MSRTPPAKENVLVLGVFFDLVSVRIRSTESRLKTTSVVTVLFRTSSTWCIVIGRSVAASASARWRTSSFQSARTKPTVCPIPCS